MARLLNRYPISSTGQTRLVVLAGTRLLCAVVEDGSLYLHTWEPHMVQVDRELIDVRVGATWSVHDDSEFSWDYDLARIPRLAVPQRFRVTRHPMDATSPHGR